jgi:serine/threonine protein kinase/Tfp pilus assembly protein PilF
LLLNSAYMGDEPNRMKPASLEQVLFAEALQLPTPEARAAYLEGACGTDTPLRRRVEVLLRAAENAGDFLEQPPGGLTVADQGTIILQCKEKPGDRIGRYKLLQQIGEGGCGVVYMAEQEEPVRRRVALKVIKLGMDTKSVIARFEAERQALALMDHPSIAKVFDAGATQTGRPYFVMELVRGIKITDYCDENNLSTEERLKLFTEVCQAIQHAHQKGIIHRDIKPSNILVTVDEPGSPGSPKVIDFGIAKATTGQRLTEKTVFTAFEQFIGTPAYMSPEQAMMTSLDIDTRTDIYALGVLLYELLTGRTPFNAEELMAGGLDAMRQILLEQEPVSPSTRLSTMLAAELTTVAVHRRAEPARLGTLLRGDLDWIVMKALEKDRKRRYETANGLAADIQRHLNNEPIAARPPSTAYRFQKMVRRNRLAFAAASAITAALVMGLGISTWMFFREKEALQKAHIEAVKSQQVAQFLKNMLEGVQPSVALGRDTVMLREILDNTADRLGKNLKGQPEAEAELRTVLGLTYLKLEESGKAEGMHREALRLRKSLLGETNELVAASLNNLSRVLISRNQWPEAEAMARQSLAINRVLHGKEHPDVALSLYVLASALQRQGKLAEAETFHREALAMRKKFLGDDPDVASSLNNLAIVLRDLGRKAEAETTLREALALQKRLFGNDHPDVAVSLTHLSAVLRDRGNLPEAESMAREVLAIRRKLFGSEHKLVAFALTGLALLLEKQERFAESDPMYREALAIGLKLLVTEQMEPFVETWLTHLASTDQKHSAPQDAEKHFQDMIRLIRETLGDSHRLLGLVLHNFAEFLRDQKRWGEAAEQYQKALPLRRTRQDENLAWTLRNLGLTLRLDGKAKDAEPFFRESIEVEKQMGARSPDSGAWAMEQLAIAFSEQGKLGEAETMLREALALNRNRFGKEHRSVEQILRNLANVLQGQNKLAEAEDVWREDLAMERKLSGDGHPFVANLLDKLALLLMRAGKFSEAEPLARECLAIRENQLPNGWLTFDARSTLGSNLLAQKKFAEAEPLLLSAFEGLKQRAEKIPLADKTRLKENMGRLVLLYDATGQSEKAAEWKKQLTELAQTETGRIVAPAKP